MLAKTCRSAPWLMVAGNVLLLLGLWRDAVLHAADPTLAAREGIFTLENGGHVLMFGGIGLITLGGALFLAGRLTRSGSSRWRRVGLALPVAALLALAISTAGIAANSGGSLATHSHPEDGHDHGTTEETEATEATDDGHGHEDGHGHDHDAPTATPTAQEQAATDQLVAETQAAAVRFADFAVAEAEGYARVTPHLAGRGPAHYVNPAYAGDDVYLDPERPESLIYLRTKDGAMHLLGVMYLATTGEGPTPGGPLTYWHGHEGLCTGPNGFARQDETGTCPPGQFPIKQEMMHLWVFDHPDGPLAEELGRKGLFAAYRQFVW